MSASYADCLLHLHLTVSGRLIRSKMSAAGAGLCGTVSGLTRVRRGETSHLVEIEGGKQGSRGSINEAVFPDPLPLWGIHGQVNEHRMQRPPHHPPKRSSPAQYGKDSVTD